jgi:predicted O-methyltransferase YrrM
MTGLPGQNAVVIDTTLPGWLPDLGGTIVGGELLRGWALSEVWRIRLAGATRKSVIVKRGIGELAGEARRYRELVVPLGIAAPRLLGEDGSGVIVLEDVGGDNLEDRPTAEGYEEAVRVLARMRAASALRLAADPALAAGLRRSTADLLKVAARAATAMTALRPDLAGAIDDPIRAMTHRLEQLSGEPETIVHGDFQAKNLLHAPGGGIVTIDWSDAYVHPHLGDLYLLLREGRGQGRIDSARMEALPALFAYETGTDPRIVIDQLVTGGLCWTMRALRWVVEAGVHAVPVSRGWIDELVADLRRLAHHHRLWLRPPPCDTGGMTDIQVARVRDVRERLVREGPAWTRTAERDFETVTLPERDCDLLRDLLISERAQTVVEVGLAYGSSALAVGEALVTVGSPDPRHIVIDPFQQQEYSNVGWDLLCSAGLDSIASLITAPSSIALSHLVTEGVVADAAFVDGSHRFHEVFVDLYFLRKIVRPGGLIVLDDDWASSVRTALRYYEQNLGFTPIPGAFDKGTCWHVDRDPAAESVPRCRAVRLPDRVFEPPFEEFRPF